jgi:hypothetical protein
MRTQQVLDFTLGDRQGGSRHGLSNLLKTRLCRHYSCFCFLGCCAFCIALKSSPTVNARTEGVVKRVIRPATGPKPTELKRYSWTEPKDFAISALVRGQIDAEFLLRSLEQLRTVISGDAQVTLKLGFRVDLALDWNTTPCANKIRNIVERWALPVAIHDDSLISDGEKASLVPCSFFGLCGAIYR